ncbi:MAG: hypothetical protein ACYDEV_10715 [Acidiferrobacter sp.]
MGSTLSRAAGALLLSSALSGIALAHVFPYTSITGALVAQSTSGSSFIGPYIAGSYEIAPHVAAFGSYSHVSGSVSGVNLSGSTLLVGGEYHWSVRRNLDVVAGGELAHVSSQYSYSYLYINGAGTLVTGSATATNTQNTLGAKGGVRWMAAPRIEVDGYVNALFCSGCSSTVTGEARYYFMPNVSVDGALATGTNSYGTVFAIGATYDF